MVMRGNVATPEAFSAIAERAEALGIDALWCSDHIIIPPQTVSRYPGSPDGEMPTSWKERYWEPFTVMAYLAARTSKIRLGISVLNLPRRNPIEVAKTIADLDQLSDGRITLGVGVGWFREEFDVLNRPFNKRGAHADEGLALCKKLWTEETPSHDGQFYKFNDVHFGPKPVQKPHPPIWVGGGSTAALKRAAKYGDGWHPLKPSFEALESGMAELKGYLEAEGRKLEGFDIAIKFHLKFQDDPPAEEQSPTEGRPEDIVAGIKRFRDAGVNHCVFDYVPETPDQAIATMERFTKEIRPKL